MDRVILLAIAAVIISLLFGQVLKGGLGLLRIISIALVFFLLVLLSARPSDSPGILPLLARRLWAENSVQISAEASGEVLTEGETLSESSETSPSFSTQSTVSSSSISPSAEAAFSGSITNAGSNDLADSIPSSTVTPQSAQATPLDTNPSTEIPPSTASSEVQSPSATRYTPPPSTSRPINALW